MVGAGHPSILFFLFFSFLRVILLGFSPMHTLLSYDIISNYKHHCSDTVNTEFMCTSSTGKNNSDGHKKGDIATSNSRAMASKIEPLLKEEDIEELERLTRESAMKALTQAHEERLAIVKREYRRITQWADEIIKFVRVSFREDAFAVARSGKNKNTNVVGGDCFEFGEKIGWKDKLAVTEAAKKYINGLVAPGPNRAFTTFYKHGGAVYEVYDSFECKFPICSLSITIKWDASDAEVQRYGRQYESFDMSKFLKELTVSTDNEQCMLQCPKENVKFHA